jgi:hypothetical protein
MAQVGPGHSRFRPGAIPSSGSCTAQSPLTAETVAPCHDLRKAADESRERDELVFFLKYQRDSVLAIVNGLSEEHWHTSVVPSGWTVCGIVEHVADAERHWFQQVINGHEIDLPWDEGRLTYDRNAPLVCDRPSADVRVYYQEQCRRSDEVLAGVSLTDRPQGRHGCAEVRSVRWVVPTHDRRNRGSLWPPRDRPRASRRPDGPRPTIVVGPQSLGAAPAQSSIHIPTSHDVGAEVLEAFVSTSTGEGRAALVVAS